MILAVWVILMIVELFISKIIPDTSRIKKCLLINIWQLFGVFLPVMWLLRVSETYLQVLPLVVMIIFYGIYKPARISTN